MSAEEGLDPVSNAVSTAPQSPHPSHSKAQRDAEPAMIAALAKKIGVPLAAKRITWPDGAYCDVDGVAADESVLAEAYAHHGRMVGAHKKKVTDDALKLVTLARSRPNVRLIIALADEVAAATFLGSSWRAEAMRVWQVEVLVVDLDKDIVTKVQDAQAAQRMTNVLAVAKVASK